VLPYANTPEGTSAAAKFCIWAGRPMIVSRETLFDDYREVSLSLQTPDAAGIATAERRVLGDESLARALADGATSHADGLAWDVVGPEYVERIRAVLAGTARMER